jgi:hypothetical protein
VLKDWEWGEGQNLGLQMGPAPDNICHSIPPWVLAHEAKVAELMDRELHGWNRGLLEDLFFPNEVKVILSIPINPNREDVLTWQGTKNGLFTVRSAYHMAKMRELQKQAESSSSTKKKKKMWWDLWILPIPNAEKNFLWRACHEILPTKVSLYKRKVVGDPLCPICSLEEETCFHILWDYPSARDVWSGSLKKFQKSSSWGTTFRQVVIEVIRGCDDEAISLFAGIA